MTSELVQPAQGTQENVLACHAKRTSIKYLVPMTHWLRLLVLISLGSTVTRATEMDFDCLSLLNLAQRQNLRLQAVRADAAELNGQQRSLHIEDLLWVEQKLHRHEELTTAGAKVLAEFESHAAGRHNVNSAKRADSILEYLSILSRSPAENLQIGMRYLERYFDEAARGYSNRTDFYYDHLRRLLTSVPSLNDNPLRIEKQRMLRMIFGSGHDYPELKILWEDPATHFSPTHRRDTNNPAPPVNIKEQALYVLDQARPTPVAYWADRTNTLDPKNIDEGFGDHGFWLRPGALIRLSEIFSDTPVTGRPLPDDTIVGRGKPTSLAFAIDLRPEDVFFDEALTQPLDQMSQFELARFSGRSGNLLHGFVSPTVFKHRPPSNF